MNDSPTILTIKKRFQEAALALPPIPVSLAPQLQERRDWCFSTKPLILSPYAFDDFVREGIRPDAPDSLVLAHAGHGVNSYALHYYLVQHPLRVFLQLAWGGAYDDAAAKERVNRCFELARRLVAALDQVRQAGRFQPGARFIVVASDFYGGYWLKPGEGLPERLGENPAQPVEAILAEAVEWATRSVKGLP